MLQIVGSETYIGFLEVYRYVNDIDDL